jgi:hypothetical protein
MANGIVQVAPDSSGKKVDTSELVVGTNSVERQRIVLAGDSVAAALAAILNADPAASDYGLVTRPIFEIIPASSNAHANVSLGNSTGKTNVLKTGNLVTTAVTADQVILTYTVTAGKTLYLLGASVQSRLTTYATTATNFGTASLESPAATKLNTQLMAHAGVIWPPPSLLFPEPIPFAAGTVLRWVCTPAAATSMTWQANLWGYEK